MDEFLQANKFTFLLIIAFSVVFIIYYITVVKKGGDKKVKEAIRSLVNEKIKDGDSYSALYATDQEYITRRKMEIRSYIIAFGRGGLYIMPITIDKSRIICFEIMHIKDKDIASIKFNKITGYSEIKLKNTNEIISYWVRGVALKTGNSAIQATVVQNKELREYIRFIELIQEKLN